VTVGKKILVWGLLIIGGLVLVGFGLFFGIARLDDADKWGSVVGATAALLGLPMTVYGLVLARRAGRHEDTRDQRVDRVSAGAGVDVLDGVGGNVRLGVPAPSVTPGAAEPAVRSDPMTPAQAPQAGEQSVTNVQAKGAVRIVRDVGGDVDISS
jgi:hypothetical protein